MFVDSYDRLVGYVGGGEDPEDPADVLAMQMVLQIEKTYPPSRHGLLVAAARAAVLLCLDDRGGPEGPWAPGLDEWCDARIRKIARRARGKPWRDVQGLWGVTAEHDGCSVRAFVPSRVGDVDQRIRKLQIGGTDVDGDLPSDDPVGASSGNETSGPTVDGLCLWLNPDLEMSVGKAAAQVGHASMLGVALFAVEDAEAWYGSGCPLDVRLADSGRWSALCTAAESGAAAAVRDAGFTEVAPGSMTVIAERAPVSVERAPVL
ncbi:peptidyl-tRNA hydrolase [Gordonia sp. HY002]|uniref:peptidyl-tRNA hydrolase n=1 Tax=Gordonia zhenghanii TaxID=2911516 RepID=UPI001EF15B9D|nr:peptidyl-tRNA hydrolase [Gordonia zhenghanii]MCF8571420.1 peptidyl-tRNA hydrolase [Gordonia zhenghanii]MCF8606734.1 peptidyl-tRNA hydrolase [Gordonia zhenghanii]